MVTYKVIGIDKFRRGGVTKYTVAGGFKSRAEAEQFLKNEARPGAGAGVSLGVEEDRPAERGDKVLGPTPSDRGRKLQRQRQQQELAAQAQEKISEGVNISGAERDALARSTGQRLPATEEINRRITEQRAAREQEKTQTVAVFSNRPEKVSREELQRRKQEDLQGRALETAARIREKQGGDEVLFSSAAFETAEKALKNSDSSLYSRDELKAAVESTLTAPRFAKITPEKQEGGVTKFIGVPLLKPEVRRVEAKGLPKDSRSRLESAALELERRDREFFNSDSFKKLYSGAEKVAGVVTGGARIGAKVKPIQERGFKEAAFQAAGLPPVKLRVKSVKPIGERGFVGAAAQATGRDLLLAPVLAPRAGVSVAEKSFLIGGALAKGGSLNFGEFRAAAKTVGKDFLRLPGYEKASVVASASFPASFRARSVFRSDVPYRVAGGFAGNLDVISADLRGQIGGRQFKGVLVSDPKTGQGTTQLSSGKRVIIQKNTATGRRTIVRDIYDFNDDVLVKNVLDVTDRGPAAPPIKTEVTKKTQFPIDILEDQPPGQAGSLLVQKEVINTEFAGSRVTESRGKVQRAEVRGEQRTRLSKLTVATKKIVAVEQADIVADFNLGSFYGVTRRKEVKLIPIDFVYEKVKRQPDVLDIQDIGGSRFRVLSREARSKTEAERSDTLRGSFEFSNLDKPYKLEIVPIKDENINFEFPKLPKRKKRGGSKPVITATTEGGQFPKEVTRQARSFAQRPSKVQVEPVITEQEFTAIKPQVSSVLDLGVLSAPKRGLKSVPLTKLSFVSRLGQASRLDSKSNLGVKSFLDQRTKPVTRSALDTRAALDTRTGLDTRSVLDTRSKVRTKTALDTRTVLGSKTGIKTGIAAPSLRLGFGPAIPVAIKLPEFDRPKSVPAKKTGKKSKRKFRGTPSLSVVALGKAAAGVKLTKEERLGKKEINPLQIRKL